MDLLKTYIEVAPFFAVINLTLLVVCILFIYLQLSLLRKEKAAFKKTRGGGYLESPVDIEKYYVKESKIAHVENDKTPEITSLERVVLSMVKKGEMVSPEIIRRRLEQSLSRHDVIVRTCLNGFVILGLLGTLYNLWKLSPDFWAGLLKGPADAPRQSIGIAFSASVVGLGCAFSVLLFETALRHAREKFVRVATNSLFEKASKSLPATDSAAVADALEKFYDASRGFLTEIKIEHEEMSQQLVRQIHDSSDALTKTLAEVSSRWLTLVNNMTQTAEHLSSDLGGRVEHLAEVTTRTSEVLDKSNARMKEAEKLDKLLVEVRAEAAVIQQRMTTYLNEFGKKWEAGLEALSKTHVERLDQTYSTSLADYHKGTERWQQESVKALGDFGAGFKASVHHLSKQIDDLTKVWGTERNEAGEQVDKLITGWRQELGQHVTGVAYQMNELHKLLNSLSGVASRLGMSYDTAYQQLQGLQNEVSAFTSGILNTTPLGKTISEMTASVGSMTATVKELQELVSANKDETTQSEITRVRSLLKEILDEMRALTGHPATPNPQPPEPEPPQPALGQPRDGVRHNDDGDSAAESDAGDFDYSSVWYRVNRLLKKDK